MPNMYKRHELYMYKGAATMRVAAAYVLLMGLRRVTAAGALMLCGHSVSMCVTDAILPLAGFDLHSLKSGHKKNPRCLCSVGISLYSIRIKRLQV